MNEPRPYRDERDLAAMQEVLVRGRLADNGSYYIHTGDLKWWLYYPPLDVNFWDHIYLWDDLQDPDRLLGWALISPDWVGIDVYVQPELRGCCEAQEMYLWAEEEANRVAVAQDRKTVHVLWVQHEDAVLTQYFTQRGFQIKKKTEQLACTLDRTLPTPALPIGYTLRGCSGEGEVVARAKAQHGAFGSQAPFERYLERFIRFMRSPVYQPEQDIVAVTPHGQVAAFCIVWLDTVNQVGLVEPMGTHPNYQRQGLGRAVILEGLRRMKLLGMKTAIVSTGEDNLPAIQLYKNVGFQVIHQLGTFEKEVYFGRTSI